MILFANMQTKYSNAKRGYKKRYKKRKRQYQRRTARGWNPVRYSRYLKKRAVHNLGDETRFTVRSSQSPDISMIGPQSIVNAGRIQNYFQDTWSLAELANSDQTVQKMADVYKYFKFNKVTITITPKTNMSAIDTGTRHAGSIGLVPIHTQDDLYASSTQSGDIVVNIADFWRTQKNCKYKKVCLDSTPIKLTVKPSIMTYTSIAVGAPSDGKTLVASYKPSYDEWLPTYEITDGKVGASALYNNTIHSGALIFFNDWLLEAGDAVYFFYDIIFEICFKGLNIEAGQY